MPYIYLIIAISTEVIGSAFLKSSEGFSKFIPSLGTIISFGICFYFLSNNRSLNNYFQRTNKSNNYSIYSFNHSRRSFVKHFRNIALIALFQLLY